MAPNIRLYFTLAILLCFTTPGLRADAIDDFMQKEMQREKIPGMAVAVVKDGKLLKAGGYGLANVEHNIPVQPDTVFKIGSVSKQFIATGIMLLAAEGKLKLDDKINQYLDDAPATWQDITIRHLLTHTSGLQRESPGFNADKQQSDATVIKAAYDRPLVFAPGERYQYCNLGYFILGEIIRKQSGKEWAAYLNDSVFAPLEMTATRATTMKEIVPKRAHGYELDGGKLVNADDYRAVRPSGAFLSTVLDLARWEAALHAGKILPPASRDAMWVPVSLRDGKKHPYGYGWEFDDFRGEPSIGHGGTLSGFRAQYLRFPAHGLTVIALANLESANLKMLTQGLASKYLPSADLTSAPALADPDAKLTEQLKGLLQNLASGAKEYPQATADLGAILARLPQSSRTALAESLKHEQSFDFLRQVDVANKGYQRLNTPFTSIRFYRLNAPERTRYCIFYLTAEGKVAMIEVTNF